MANRSRQATAKQQRFAELYLTGTMSGADCYRLAYNSKAKPITAQAEASRLLGHPLIAAIILEGRRTAVKAIAMDQAALVKQWSDAATVDRNELVEVRRHCCRYCYGAGHEYQETPAERKARYAHYVQAAASAKGAWPEFDERGGLGYDRRKPPSEDCPECSGFGETMVILKDTRGLSPAARSLYEGVDIKNGSIVVKVRDREGAEDKLARHLGMLSGGGDGGSTVNVQVNVNDAIPDEPIEASKVYQKLLPG